ncbi:MAG: winged helix-turn-helix transcriptional regulator [Deltaproteobacteria bacterium]|nr:winged helix-turn-helix transcriptional regulator [Deltaproteobacteria bacterium]
MDVLTEKEEAVLTYIANHSRGSQREIAKVTAISLGLINVILKRFVKTGYLKISRLNKKQLEYIITPYGILESIKRSCRYATNTIRNYQLLQHRLEDLLAELEQQGIRYVSIHGNGELRQLLESLIRCRNGASDYELGTEHRSDPGAVVLSVAPETLDGTFAGTVVNVLQRIEVAR